MPNNNPEGVNSFDHFAAEPAYGEATAQSRLAGGAPLAGQSVASGPIGAPKRAQRATQAAPVAAAGVLPPSAVPAAVNPWAQIAALPGISPLAAEYAARMQG